MRIPPIVSMAIIIISIGVLLRSLFGDYAEQPAHAQTFTKPTLEDRVTILEQSVTILMKHEIERLTAEYTKKQFKQ